MEAPSPKVIAVPLSAAPKLSGLSRSMIYKLIHNGSLTPLKCGRKTLLLYDELRAVIHGLPKGLGAEPEGPKIQRRV